jgi:hypothetical protein
VGYYDAIKRGREGYDQEFAVHPKGTGLINAKPLLYERIKGRK